MILISLDGYRWDYTERFQPENITKFIRQGTGAEALIPSFPSKTFPNHYTIATGMKPEHHGLVDNSFYDLDKKQTFVINDREIVQDSYWYGGTPIWVLAEQNGLTTASYFFIGTEAPVQGIQPSYFYNYDADVSNSARISKVFEWLELPEQERPRLITLYFSDMDDVGHRYGPDNDEQISTKLKLLDKELGSLFEGIKNFDLDINVILVSDHGMTNVSKKNLLNLDQLTEGIAGKVVNNGALAHIYLENPTEKKEVIEQLELRKNHFEISDVEGMQWYRDIDTYRNRLGDVLILPELGYYLATSADMVKYQNRASMFHTDIFGEHGFSPENRDMHGIFYANGPVLDSGKTIPAFENIHIYPLIATILDLPIPTAIDGDINVLMPVLKR